MTSGGTVSTRQAPAEGLQPSRLRGVVWAGHMALPMLGLWLLVAQPEADLHWEHHGWHFVLIAGVALANLALAVRIRGHARRRGDARLLLTSLAFLASAGFLLLHSLATPQVILAGPNSGFVVATPVGLLLAALLAVWSSSEFGPEGSQRLVAQERWLFAALLAVMAAWAVVSLAGLPPLDRVPEAAEAHGWIGPMALVGVPLYGLAALRYYLIYRRRRAVMLLSMITAFVLLGQSLVAVWLARNWQLSWWLWHVLMAAGFLFVYYSAKVQEGRAGRPASLFTGIALDQTNREIRAEHRAALQELVEAIRRSGEQGDGAELGPVTARLAARFGLSDAEAGVLESGARATFEVERLRVQLDALLHQYLSPEVAQALIDDPSRAELGGATQEVTVLFADLRGFTPFAERTEPATVVAVLNSYFERAVRIVIDHGGVVVQFVGDAIMALFNAPNPVEGHALRAAACGLELQRAVVEVAEGHPEWPRFRVGINTGPALVGNIGGTVRNFTAIGDTTNLAARLESAAEPGQVVVGEATYEAIRDHAEVEALPPLDVKGKARPVAAYVLHELRPARAGRHPGGS